MSELKFPNDDDNGTLLCILHFNICIKAEGYEMHLALALVNEYISFTT